MDRHREITKFHAFLRGGEEGRRRILVLWGLSHKRCPRWRRFLASIIDKRPVAIFACGEIENETY
jgi:hypothetical protein